MRGGVSLSAWGYPNNKKKIRKYDAQESIFDKIWGVWLADETLSLVFDLSSRSKLKLWSKRRNKIVNVYAN